jgi:hypothetical protein
LAHAHQNHTIRLWSGVPLRAIPNAIAKLIVTYSHTSLHKTVSSLFSHFLMTGSIYRLYGYQDRSTRSFHSPFNERMLDDLSHRRVFLPARVYVGRALVRLEYCGNHQNQD